MNSRLPIGVFLILCATLARPTTTAAQQAGAPGALATSSVVPNLINYNGTLRDSTGRTISSLTGVTFLLYRDEHGGAPLWIETQNITPDKFGRYTVQLGASKNGIPPDLFLNGEARWLAVQIANEPEQARALLVAVPYAVKSVDAQTLGGLPPSAFVLAAPPTSGTAPAAASDSTAGSAIAPLGPPNVTTSGSVKPGTVPLFHTITDIEGSIVTQTGTTGINVAGRLNLPATGTATTLKAFNSQPERFVASVNNSSAAVAQTFQWQAEGVNNGKPTASGSLNLLYAAGTATAAETGLKVNSKGQVSFVPGQTYPGAGTVTSVGLIAPTSDFTVSGSPVSGNGALTLKWIFTPTSLDTANAIVKRDGNGNFTAGQIISNLGVAGFTKQNCAACAGVSGINNGTATGGAGLYGKSAAMSGYGVYGENDATGGAGVKGLTNGGSFGVIGENDDPAGGTGVFGSSNGSSGGFGVFGAATGPNGVGVAGSPNLNGFAVVANSIYSTAPVGVFGDATNGYGIVATSDNSNAFFAENGSAADTSVIINEGGGNPLFVAGASTLGGAFNGTMTLDGNGNLSITGSMSKTGGSFKIDHPLDPANKYLYHSFVESPDMKNIYDGVATLDANGEAVIHMPEWFAVLNRDVRYQLTCIGGFAPVYIAEELANNQFKIGGGRPGLKVSWQVTGIRQDAWANAHRIPVEEEKNARERGFYIHPELYGEPPEKQIEWARHPQMMKRIKETRAHQIAVSQRTGTQSTVGSTRR